MITNLKEYLLTNTEDAKDAFGNECNADDPNNCRFHHTGKYAGHQLHSFANGAAVNPSMPGEPWRKGRIPGDGDFEILDDRVHQYNSPYEVSLYDRGSFAKKMAQKRMTLGQRANQAEADYALAHGTPAEANAKRNRDDAQEALAQHQSFILVKNK